MSFYDFPEQGGYTILHLDRKVCHICYTKEALNFIKYSIYDKVRLFQLLFEPFEKGDISYATDFLYSRTVEEFHPRREEMFEHVGLTEYKPYEYVRRLHGVFNADGFWVYFDDDWLDKRFRPPVYCKQGCSLDE